MVELKVRPQFKRISVEELSKEERDKLQYHENKKKVRKDED